MSDAGERYAQLIEAARLAAGQPAEAERLLTEAIAVGEEHLGGNHPSLGVALNELSRLYIRRSEFSRAEEVLERLLRITRTRGERHPDVATALAGLAVAKRGLGDHASAEQLFRQALGIREAVLAPDHMAIVITLEQLSETCAARGQHAEALVHLQRALLRRERALGADHATVHALRARNADLERRIAESSSRAVELTAAPPVSASEAAPAPALPPSLPKARVVADAPVVAVSSAKAPTRRTPSRRKTTYVPAAAALALLAIAGFAFRSRTANEREPSFAQAGAPSPAADVTPASMENPPAPLGASGSVVVNPDSGPAAAPSGYDSAAALSAAQPTAASDTPSTAPSAPAARALPSLRRLAIPKVAMPSLDSVVLASANAAHDVGTGTIGTEGMLRAPASDAETGATPPVLIGPSPTPRFPDELRAQRVEGEVVVRFRVNEKGRVDVSTMQVIESPHEKLTAAVRSVLPRFRFEPARSAAPESKPQAAWVQFRTQFSARN